MATVHRARRDVNAFAALCFNDPAGKPLRPAPIHRELQAFLTRHARALIELPRDHGKSMQVCMRLLWELGRRPGLRIKIVCATQALAIERGRFMRDAIAENRRLRLVFPHLHPGKPWEAERFTVHRSSRMIGPSVAAMGVGGGSTGARADLLVCDDIVDVKAIRSRADRDRAAIHFRENLVNLLEPDGRLWCMFTPWHEADLNAELKSSGVYAHLRRAIGPNLEPVWPEKWPVARLAERRREIGEIAFARGYRLVCVSDEEIAIRPEWVRFWTQPTDYEMVIIAIDPAATANDRSDFSALVVLGRDEHGIVYCLEATARKLPAPELVRLIDAADQHWRPDAILFESQAAFAAMRDLLAVHARFGPKLQSVNQSRDKRSRAMAFGVHVENGRFLLRGDGTGRVHPSQQELFDEMTTFPLAQHDDLLDAAAFGAAHLLNQRPPRAW